MAEFDTPPAAPSKGPRPRFRWRRLVQYRLRTLLILMTLLAVGLGWWSHSVRRQRDAVAALKKHISEIEYDYQRQGHAKPPHWPAWLVDRLGIDWFATVQHLDLTDSATDVDLFHVRSLAELQELGLDYSNVTDAGLVNLQSLTELQKLDLGRTQVTDVGLVYLRNLVELRQLDLDGTTVTDAGLVHLERLAELQWLSLHNTTVTDAGLVHLCGLSGLQWLDLSSTAVTDAGLVHLRGLTGLKVLLLRDTNVTDDGVERLHQSLPTCSISQ